MADLTTT